MPHNPFEEESPMGKMPKPYSAKEMSPAGGPEKVPMGEKKEKMGKMGPADSAQKMNAELSNVIGVLEDLIASAEQYGVYNDSKSLKALNSIVNDAKEVSRRWMEQQEPMGEEVPESSIFAPRKTGIVKQTKEVEQKNRYNPYGGLVTKV